MVDNAALQDRLRKRQRQTAAFRRFGYACQRHGSSLSISSAG
jgi:hypothetical protein